MTCLKPGHILPASFPKAGYKECIFFLRASRSDRFSRKPTYQAKTCSWGSPVTYFLLFSLSAKLFFLMVHYIIKVLQKIREWANTCYNLQRLNDNNNEKLLKMCKL